MSNDVSKAEFGSLTPGESSDANSSHRNLQLLYDLSINVNVRLGSTIMTIRELLNLSPGSVIELDRQAGESCDLYVNEVLMGKGEVVVINDNYGLRITEIISSEERLKSIQ